MVISIFKFQIVKKFSIQIYYEPISPSNMSGYSIPFPSYDPCFCSAVSILAFSKSSSVRTVSFSTTSLVISFNKILVERNMCSILNSKTPKYTPSHFWNSMPLK